jgi:hypothetical protein
MTKNRIIQFFKYLINIVVALVLAWGAFLDYALWVQPPIGKTREESVDLLQSGIIDKGIGLAITGLLIIGTLTFLTWLVQVKIEKQKNLKELFLTVLIDSLIVVFGIGLGAFDAYNGLIVEINRVF